MRRCFSLTAIGLMSLWTSPVWASEDGGHHGGFAFDVVYPFASFLIFIGLLVYLARRPVQDALHNRALTIRKSIEDAAKERAEAEARYNELNQRIQALGGRIEEMKAEARREADLEAARLVERAAQESARLRDVAERTIRDESIRAQQQLRTEAIRLAANLAREQISASLTSADQIRLDQEFLSSLEDKNSSTQTGRLS